VSPAQLVAGPDRARGAVAGPLRSEGVLRPSRSGDDGQHDRVPRTGPRRRPFAHAPDPAIGQRTEDDEARRRSLLGHRRRIPQPGRRARRRRVVHRLRLPAGRRLMSVTAAKKLLLSDVTTGNRLPELAYRVTATTIVLGALAARDWRPMHHDYDFAVHRNGTQDIFMNTPNQAAWFERYLTDCSGPKGRLGRMKFRMKGSVVPGGTLVLAR